MATAFDYATYADFKAASATEVRPILEMCARRLGLRNRYLRFIRDANRQALVVELGCGPGHFLHELSSAGFDTVVGVDACAAYAAPGIKHGDATEFLAGQPRQSVGAIIALDLLEHLEPHQISSLLGQAARVLMRDGLMLIRVPNAASPLGMANQAGDLSHRSALTEVSIKQLAFDAGLRCASFEEPLSYPRSLSAIVGRAMWPLYRAATRAVLASFGQHPTVLTPNLVCVLRHRTVV